MLTTDQIRTFLLEYDKTHTVPIQVYVNGIRVLQQNGSNPRCWQIPPEKAVLIPGLEDTLTAWQCRIVKHPGLSGVIAPSGRWGISLDGGTTVIPHRCVPPILETRSNVAWIVTLTKI